MDDTLPLVQPQPHHQPTTRTRDHCNSRNFYLALLVLQNTSKTLIMRFAVHGKPNFLYSAAVLATEALKCSLSILTVLATGGSIKSIAHFLSSEWRVFVRVLVPAGVYNCQQMLEFVALARLEAPVFSVIVQTKLLTTAIFSYALLGKKLTRKQVLALFLLMVGVILAQQSTRKHNITATADLLSHEAIVGMCATLMIATLSGFAAVYTEGVLKHAKLEAHDTADSLAYMQIQMASASILVIGAFAAVQDTPAILEHGLWYGFDVAAVVAVVSSALGGIIVSAVLKHADSVLKGYATAASVVLTGILSSLFFGTSLDSYFIWATVIVTYSIQMYNSHRVIQEG